MALSFVFPAVAGANQRQLRLQSNMLLEILDVRWRMDDEVTVRACHCLRWRLPHRDGMQLLFNLLTSIDE